MLDRFLAPNTHEAAAYNYLSSVFLFLSFLTAADVAVLFSSEHWPTWYTDQPSVDESLISGCASYRAFDRYIGGRDLFLLPRTRIELESIL
jgi:hypothetical protein